MATKPIVRFQRAGNIPQLNRRVEDFTKQVSDCPLLSGRLITEIAFSGAVTVVIDHKLGRQPQGWVLVDVDAAITVSRTAWTSTTLSLAGSGAGNISIWVF